MWLKERREVCERQTASNKRRSSFWVVTKSAVAVTAGETNKRTAIVRAFNYESINGRLLHVPLLLLRTPPPTPTPKVSRACVDGAAWQDNSTAPFPISHKGNLRRCVASAQVQTPAPIIFTFAHTLSLSRARMLLQHHVFGALWHQFRPQCFWEWSSNDHFSNFFSARLKCVRCEERQLINFFQATLWVQNADNYKINRCQL